MPSTTSPFISERAGPGGRPIRFRSAVADDAPATLAHLAAAGEETPFLPFGGEGVGRTEEQERAFLASLPEHDNRLAVVAEWDGRIVGYLTFSGDTRRRTRHVGEFGIAVARECWGFGVGRHLIELLIAWARGGTAVRKINLRVRADNERAIALYRSLGFREEGRLSRDNWDDGVFYDGLTMGLEIDPEEP